MFYFVLVDLPTLFGDTMTVATLGIYVTLYTRTIFVPMRHSKLV